MSKRDKYPDGEFDEWLTLVVATLAMVFWSLVAALPGAWKIPPVLPAVLLTLLTGVAVGTIMAAQGINYRDPQPKKKR